MGATIALFHSVLGVRAGIEDAVQRLTAAGHDVVVVDQYAGRTFDDYDEAHSKTDMMSSTSFPRNAAQNRSSSCRIYATSSASFEVTSQRFAASWAHRLRTARRRHCRWR